MRRLPIATALLITGWRAISTTTTTTALTVGSSPGRRTRSTPSRHGNRRKPLRQRDDVWAIERALLPEFTHVIGSDESGSGCIAGPVVTASCCVRDNAADGLWIDGVDDSKSLSTKDRERIYEAIVQNPSRYLWSIQERSAAEIDEQSATNATLNCFQDSIEDVVSQLRAEYPHCQPYSIVDGHRSPKVDGCTSRPWKQGDAYVYTVALASVLARVTRDRHMALAAVKYPLYDFDRNGGYPSRAHTEILHQHGYSPIHRQSCKPVLNRHGNLSSRKEAMTVLLTACTVGFSSFGWVSQAEAMTNDPKTGTALPDKGEIETSIPTDWSTVDNPLEGDEKALFGTLDSSSDSIFYSDPRFVEHVDDQAVGILTSYVSQTVAHIPDAAVLDLCSSWTSHLEPKVSCARVAGLGMNAKELQANAVLTEWTVQDLNKNANLPYASGSFDTIFCQLSIDYLRQPLEVCREIGRVLKSGGTAHVLFSNRLFLSKAVGIWTGADDIDHAFTVGAYFHFCRDGLFRDIQAKDLSVRKGRNQRISGDPLYVVTATRI
jgi:ribonuclease HII